MPMSYAKNKQHALNYRLKNMDKVRENSRNSMRKRYAWKKISFIFMNILIDEY